MSTHVVGLRPASDDYKKKLKAYTACIEAGVPPPKELSVYFDYVSEPDPNGMEVCLDQSLAVQEYKKRGKDGFDVDVTKLPEGVTIVRFYNSY